MRGRAVVALAAALLVVRGVACTVEDLALDGKRCPCAVGYRCDVPTSTCVSDGFDGGPGIDDGGTGRDAPVGAFVVQRFVATWQTSRSIRWDWEVSGEPGEFAEYQLIVGGSEDAVRRQDSTTSLFDRRINPELGNYGGRDPVPSGALARAWTVTDRHNPSKTVFARLVVRDKAGRENASNVISAHTLGEDAASALVLFSDQIVDGSATTPAELKRVTNDCFNGSAGCLQIAKVDCPNDAATCAFEMGLQNFSKLNVVSGMTSDSFRNAFVELGVRGGSNASPKPQSDLILEIGPPACVINGKKCRFRWYSGWSFRPGTKEFRLVQVPLASLLLETETGPGPALKFEDLSANALKIDGLTIDGEWRAGSNIGLDQAHVRW
jgi:hypothetical protein